MIKVLIADDEPLLLRSLKKSIEMMDGEYSVIDTASDGKSALKKAEALNPDVIFTDIRMPIFDGLEFVGKLREKGMKSTQATISRDIKELHLVKELTGRSTYKYAVSERKTSLNVAGRLNNIFRESVTSFDSAQNIVVLKTMPGLASAACSALDGMHLPNMVGSLAGDDTAILIMRTTQDAEELCLEIVKMLEKNP